MLGFAAAFDRQLAAFNASDLDAFVAAYGPTATISRDEKWSLRGSNEIRAFYRERFLDKSLHCEVIGLQSFGERWLTAHEKVRSADSEVQVVAIFEILDDQITRATMLTAPV